VSTVTAVRRAILIVASAVLTGALVSCGRAEREPAPASSAPEARPATPTAATTVATPPELVADAARFLELLRKDRTKVVREIGRTESAVQARLLEFSGVAADLGGGSKAAAALADLLREVEATIWPTEAMRWQRVADNGEASAVFAVASAAVELAAVAFEFKSVSGDAAATRSGFENETGKAALDVANGNISYRSDKSIATAELAATLSNRMTVNVCPDAAGEIKLELEVKASIRRANGSKGVNVDIRATAAARLDDDANMGDYDYRSNFQSAAFGGPTSGSFVDLDLNLSSRPGGANGTRVNRRSTQATDADIADTKALAQMIEIMAIGYLGLTSQAWESGQCVRLDVEATPAKRNGTAPSTNFSLVASPRSKVDGSAAGGTVRGQLQGGSVLEPNNSKVRADANFRYAAPDDKNERATVGLEARSKRGVTRSDVEFDTAAQAYALTGGAGEFAGTGVICNLEETFFATGNGVTVRFEPSSRDGGRYSYSGNMSGFRVYGNGTYIIEFQGDEPSRLIAKGPGTVETPNGKRSDEGTEVYAVKRSEPVDCGPASR
jgi:hypothetical protein